MQVFIQKLNKNMCYSEAVILVCGIFFIQGMNLSLFPAVRSMQILKTHSFFFSFYHMLL